MEKERKTGKTRKKKRLFWLLPGAMALAALAVGSVLFWALSAMPAAPPDLLPAQAQSLEGVEVLSIAEWDAAYIQVYYPHTQRQEINDAVDEYIAGAVAEFKAGMKKSSRPEKDEFSIGFEMFRFDRDVVSFLFRSYAFYVGGARGVDGVHTMTFDLQSGERYDLGSLFREEGAQGGFLRELSSRAYQSLSLLRVYMESEAERALLREGTAPLAENFSNFVLEDDTLRFCFAPGQIGSRGNPTYQLDLPLASLKEMMRPRFADAIPAEDPVPGSAPDVSALAGKKLVALTFDDGPHPQLTPQLLDFLRQEQVHVTFFVLGCWVRNTPEIIRRAADEGHQVGSHTYGHRDLTKLDAETRAKEIGRNAALIESILGYPPTALRPPYGAYDDAVRAAVDTPLILWSIDPKDWKLLNAQPVVAHVLEKAYDGCIILMHDYYPTSIEAAMAIIPALKERGYTFVTVDELLAARGGAQAGQPVRERRP